MLHIYRLERRIADLMQEGGHSTLLGIGEQVSGLVQPGVRLSDRGQSCSVAVSPACTSRCSWLSSKARPFFPQAA